MTKKIVITIIVLMLVAGGVFLFLESRKKKEILDETEETETINSGTVIDLGRITAKKKVSLNDDIVREAQKQKIFE